MAKIKIHKMDEPLKGIFAMRVQFSRYLKNPVATISQLPKIGDGWYADVFIEEGPKKK